MASGLVKPNNRPAGEGNAFPLARFAGLLLKGSVSLDSQSPKGSLRIQFPCHPAKAVGLWAPGNSGNGDYDSNDGKTIQPGLWPVGNAPLLSPAATSPPEGEILAALYIVMLMRTNAERREVYSAP